MSDLYYFFIFFLGNLKLPTKKHIIFIILKLLIFSRKDREVEEEMRTFFSMKRGVEDRESLAEALNSYEWQSRLNATSHPHLRSCYSSLHFRAAFWSPRLQLAYSVYQGETESRRIDSKQRVDSAASVHPWAHFTADRHPHEFCHRKAQVLVKESSASDTALRSSLSLLTVYCDTECRTFRPVPDVYLNKLMFLGWNSSSLIHQTPSATSKAFSRCKLSQHHHKTLNLWKERAPLLPYWLQKSGLPQCLSGIESLCNAEVAGDIGISGLGRSCRRAW